MVLCDVRWSDAKDSRDGECKNYTDVLGVFSSEYTTMDNRAIYIFMEACSGFNKKIHV